jgi:hypothetical protein
VLGVQAGALTEARHAEAALRSFITSGKNLKAADMAAAFLKNIQQITRACQVSGPFISIVYREGIRQVRLD